MQPLFPPYRTQARFGRSGPHGPPSPLVWAVRVPDRRTARRLFGRLDRLGVRAAEIVLAKDCRLYVRWAD